MLIEIGGSLCHYQIQIYTYGSQFSTSPPPPFTPAAQSALNKPIFKKQIKNLLNRSGSADSKE